MVDIRDTSADEPARHGDDHDDDHDDEHDGAGDVGPHGEVVVLAWWQHPLNILTIVVAVALVAGMVGWLVGDSRTARTGNDVDVGFLQDMREHHEQAVAMSFIYLDRPDTRPGLRTVARSITFGQGIEIGRMIQLLRDLGADEANMGDAAMVWMGMSSEVGSMPGMASREQLDELSRSAGADADRLFVELMTAHHLGGIEMAEFAAERADDAEVRAMAASMAAAQRSEIGEMERLLDP